jgi:two-component system response regulator HydG
MVVQDHDGTLDLNDIQEGDSLRSIVAADNHSASPGGLVGRPLDEVERFYIDQTLGLTGGNREEAARLLGIGERTLYRKIKKWELEKRPASSQEKD